MIDGKVIILGIESSCDETAAAITANGRELLSNVVSTQIADHAPFGGVVPEIAARKHVEMAIPVVDQALAEAGVTPDQIDGIAVTYGPGLAGALLSGIATAKGLAYGWNKPLIPVHHISGHISANYLDHIDLEPPFICLVASGGHSNIVAVDGYGKYRLLAHTRDDAAGEAFDKVAKVMGLPYPGGIRIDQLAQSGNADAFAFPTTRFEKGCLDFSFSGIKTAVMNTVNNIKDRGEEIPLEDVAASFQAAVTKVLVKHTFEAAVREGYKTVCVAGGVGANSELRRRMVTAGAKHGMRVRLPSKPLCGDNGAMISCAGYYEYMAGHIGDMTLDAVTRDNSIYQN